MNYWTRHYSITNAGTNFAIIRNKSKYRNTRIVPVHLVLVFDVAWFHVAYCKRVLWTRIASSSPDPVTKRRAQPCSNFVRRKKEFSDCDGETKRDETAPPSLPPSQCFFLSLFVCLPRMLHRCFLTNFHCVLAPNSRFTNGSAVNDVILHGSFFELVTSLQNRDRLSPPLSPSFFAQKQEGRRKRFGPARKRKNVYVPKPKSTYAIAQ